MTTTHAPYDILTEWKGNVTLTIPMRYGTSSWGYRHIVDDHNVTTNVARTATKFPTYRKVESSSSIVYRVPVNYYVCSYLVCTIKASAMVRTVVNPTILSDGHRKGVITTYCEEYLGFCPDWVKDALNAN